MTCTTCHNPHDIPRGEAAARYYSSVCRQCHGQLTVTHSSNSDCVTCHMPKRRTDDAVHVVMTDHLIQRQANLKESHPEEYRGPVVPYYPSTPDALYAALAQDSQREVEASVRANPNLAEAHELLGGLLARNHNLDAALIEYREAVRLKPSFGRAQLDLAATLAIGGDKTGAVEHFREAAKSADPKIAEQALRALQQIGAPK